MLGIAKAYLDNVDPTDVSVSPALGPIEEFGSLPPLLVQVGSTP